MDMHWTPKRRQSIEWDERSLLVSKLTGEHNIPSLGGVDVRWKAFTSRSEAKKPDMKAIDYQYQGRDRETGEIIWGMCENYRIWSDLEEKNTGLEADLTYPLGAAKVKAGIHSSLRSRDFKVDAFYSDHKNQQELIQLPVEEIFDPDNYGPGQFRFKSYGPFSGKYEADEHLDAYYGMMDLPFGILGRSFRFVGGARIERSDISVEGKTGQVIEDFTSGLEDTDILPSTNLTFMINDNTNLRAAYSHSVNRPEFRELADVLYYDYHELQNVRGNPDLKRALIRNYDLRFEWFPRVGEVLAASYFYKDFDDAIEIRLLSNPDRAVRTWFNSSDGRNQGWELEARKSLDYSYDGAGAFFPLPWTCLYYLLGSETGRVTLTANYTRIESEIEYKHKNTNVWPHRVTTETRPLQGQSPWMTNVSLTFEDTDLQSSFSVLFNSIGRRLSAVGDSRDEDVYEEPRDVIDLAITQGLGQRLKLKVTAKDVLSEPEVFTMGWGRSYRKVSKSASYSFSLAYNM
jgi:outer membrane receptor protein involved in Fe transport